MNLHYFRFSNHRPSAGGWPVVGLIMVVSKKEFSSWNVNKLVKVLILINRRVSIPWLVIFSYSYNRPQISWSRESLIKSTWLQADLYPYQPIALAECMLPGRAHQLISFKPCWLIAGSALNKQRILKLNTLNALYPSTLEVCSEKRNGICNLSYRYRRHVKRACIQLAIMSTTLNDN